MWSQPEQSHVLLIFRSQEKQKTYHNDLVNQILYFAFELEVWGMSEHNRFTFGTKFAFFYLARKAIESGNFSFFRISPRYSSLSAIFISVWFLNILYVQKQSSIKVIGSFHLSDINLTELKSSFSLLLELYQWVQVPFLRSKLQVFLHKIYLWEMAAKIFIDSV